MKRFVSKVFFVFLIFLIYLLPCSHSDAQGMRLSYVRLYSDENGITHFADESIPWSTNYGNVMLTDLFKAENVGFVRALPGWSMDWHPAPRRQLVMILEGTMEEEVGDGEKRIFEPGSILLVEDNEGKGHKTKVVGQKALLFVWVPISSDFPLK